jgi:hypothetical protein
MSYGTEVSPPENVQFPKKTLLASSDLEDEGVGWNLPNLTVREQGSLSEILEDFQMQLNSYFFMNAIILLIRTIWTARND